MPHTVFSRLKYVIWNNAAWLTTITEGSNVITYGYDNLDRMTTETTPLAGTNYTTTYGFDNNGRRTSLTVPGQTAITYGYDNADRLTSITQGSSIVNFAYNTASVTTQVKLPNGISMDYAFDNAWQLTGITYKNSAGTTLGNLGYTYDNAGQRTSTTGSYARTGLPTALSANAVYDNNNRVTSFAGATITYDANGNMLSDGTRTFTWDARDRLTSISGGATASFTYDALGRRTSKTISGTTTRFLYDGLNPVQERNSSNAVNANLLTGGLDQYFSRTEGAVSRFFMTDALGSTLALTDSSQAVQTSYTYEPFGKVTQTGAASTNSLKYTGREDDGTGLFYYRARYYNPTMQRFISEDPIGLEGGLNKYSYAADNPLMYSDPGGTNPLLLGACVIGGGINAINYAINGKDPLTGFGIGFVATGVGILTTTVTGPAGLAILAEGTAISAGAVTTGIATTTANRFNGVYSSPDPAFDYAIGIVGSYGSAKLGIAVAGAKGGQAVPVVAGFIGEAVGNNTVNVGFTGLGILYPELWRNINNPLRGIIPNYPYPGSGTRR